MRQQCRIPSDMAVCAQNVNPVPAQNDENAPDPSQQTVAASSSNQGVVIGVGVGAAVVLVLAGIVGFILFRRRRRGRQGVQKGGSAGGGGGFLGFKKNKVAYSKASSNVTLEELEPTYHVGNVGEQVVIADRSGVDVGSRTSTSKSGPPPPLPAKDQMDSAASRTVTTTTTTSVKTTVKAGESEAVERTVTSTTTASGVGRLYTLDLGSVSDEPARTQTTTTVLKAQAKTHSPTSDVHPQPLIPQPPRPDDTTTTVVSASVKQVPSSEIKKTEATKVTEEEQPLKRKDSLAYTKTKQVVVKESEQSGTGNETVQMVSMPEPQPQQTSVLDKCAARRAHVKRMDDELDVVIGDDIMVEKYFMDGWCMAQNMRTGARGVLPQLCLKK
ncbi:hypothetical protein HK102_007164 [Quaeritorhiza haematococci]|nr:hypothetical protein HK102_007164 [Quaeritorhiza haematococci]